LVIGIDDYLGSPLHCCMNDAEEIARLLKTNSDGSKILMYFKKEYTRERRFGKDD
jgi:hypothetical protein